VLAVAVEPLLCLKEIATALKMDPRSVKRLYKRLGIEPTIPAHACHRWSQEDFQRLLTAWKEDANRRAKRT